MQNKIKKHFLFYRLLRPVVRAVAWVVMGYRCKLAPKIEGNYLVLANHTTNWDPLFVACSFKKPMTFIGSEHAFRMGFLSKIISGLFAPIQRVKGSTDAQAALSLVSMLRKGIDVALFPEGTRSFDGQTAKLHSTTGRLVKISGAGLVTYRISGGYLTTPRWGKGIRRGKITGEVVNVYTAQQLKEMSAEEIIAHINEDIHENAFDTQLEKMCKYKGKNPAQGLERVLYTCPKCGKIGTLKSEGKMISCSCGLHATFDECGFLQGDGLPFDRIDKWNEWQREELRKATEIDSFELCDTDQELYSVEKDHSVTKLAVGTLRLNREGFFFGEKLFPINAVSPAIIRKQNVVFTFEGTNYEIRSEKIISALKYIEAFEALKERIAQKD